MFVGTGITAYTYEADVHCVECTNDRFGPWDSEMIDSEGNPARPIFDWDEWWDWADPDPQILACGTCGDVIAELDDETEVI